MTTVQDSIPEALRDEVDAAIQWFNRDRNDTLEVTGIVDPERSLATTGSASAPRELKLVLCGGDFCEQRTFHVVKSGDGFLVELVQPTEEKDPATPIAELDPPPGARKSWLESACRKHAFVVLIFYRGFW